MFIDIRKQLRQLSIFVRTYGIETHQETLDEDSGLQTFFLIINNTNTEEIKKTIQDRIYPKLTQILKSTDTGDEKHLTLDWLSVDHNSGETKLKLLVSDISEKFSVSKATTFFKKYFGDSLTILSQDTKPALEYSKIIDAIQTYQAELKAHYQKNFTTFYDDRLQSQFKQKWNSLALSLLRDNIYKKPSMKKQKTGGSRAMLGEVETDITTLFGYYRNLAKQVVFRHDLEENHVGMSVRFKGEKTGLVVKQDGDNYTIITMDKKQNPPKLQTVIIKASDIDVIYQPIDNHLNKLQQKSFDGMIKPSELRPTRDNVQKLILHYIKKQPSSALAKTIETNIEQFKIDLKEAFAR